jgi:hypothetical protein
LLPAVVHLSLNPFIFEELHTRILENAVFCSDRRYRRPDSHLTAFRQDRVLRAYLLFKMLFSSSVDPPFEFELLAAIAVYRPRASAGMTSKKDMVNLEPIREEKSEADLASSRRTA